MKIFVTVLKKLLYIYDLPFIIQCKQFGKDSLIGLGYSLFFSSKKGVTIGNRISIGANATIQTVQNKHYTNPEVIIGDNTMVGRDFFCSASNLIHIGKNCLFSWRVTILDHDHNFDTTSRPVVEKGITKGIQVTIGDGTFVGINTVILKGVDLGANCVVGANSVVTQSFPANSIIAGNPAKIIGSLDSREKIRL